MTEEQMEVVRLHMRDTYDVAPWEWDSGELELAIYELITKNQAKNNEVLDLVSYRFLAIDSYPDMKHKVNDVIELPSDDFRYDDGTYCDAQYFRTYSDYFKEL